MPEIHLPVFQGPLDLLLHLIERDDLDITAVSLVAVTDQFLKAIHDGDSFDPQAMAEFVAIGAKLIYLKSRALLPRAPVDDAEELEDDDVGRELVDLLLEYKRYGQAADMLQQRQEAGVRVYSRMAPTPILENHDTGLSDVTMEALCAIMMDVLARTPPEPKAVLPRDGITLVQCIGDFRERLRRHGKFSFRQMIAECGSRLEVIISFMAVLELLKNGECDARQSAAWGDIEVAASYVAAAGR
jgi:segregation and condensation protein A